MRAASVLTLFALTLTGCPGEKRSELEPEVRPMQAVEQVRVRTQKAEDAMQKRADEAEKQLEEADPYDVGE